VVFGLGQTPPVNRRGVHRLDLPGHQPQGHGQAVDGLLVQHPASVGIGAAPAAEVARIAPHRKPHLRPYDGRWLDE
jgi:hypothetical protein